MKSPNSELKVRIEPSAAFFLILGLLILFGSLFSPLQVISEEGKVEDKGHTETSEDRYYIFEREEVILEDFEAPGWILDIGGGGEGVIGRLKGDQVIAIDISKRELEEAPDGPLKIIMDASDLSFLDGTFPTATSFFTLMYIPGSLHQKVFEEIYRVLQPEGKFLIWDLTLPTCLDEDKEVPVILLTIKMLGKELTPGYGTKWPSQNQDLAYYMKLAKAAGFKVLEQEEKGQIFSLILQKPKN
jgi:ubiquinone/menaquinone biosynthesis C-methylase UbiE